MNQWWTKQNTVINSDIDGIGKQTSNRKNNRETNHLFNQQTNQPADQQTPQLTSAGQQTSKHACICTHFGIIASIFDSLHGFADWGWQALYDRKRDNDLMVCICLYVMQEGECVVCVCVCLRMCACETSTKNMLNYCGWQTRLSGIAQWGNVALISRRGPDGPTAFSLLAC